MNRTAIRLRVFKKFFLGAGVIAAFLVGGLICLLRIQYNNVYTENVHSKAESVASSVALAVKGRLGDGELPDELSRLLSGFRGARISVYSCEPRGFVCVFDGCVTEEGISISSTAPGSVITDGYVESAYTAGKMYSPKAAHDTDILGKSVTCCVPVTEKGGRTDAVIRVDFSMGGSFIGAEKYSIYYMLVFTLLALSVLLYCLYVFRIIIRPLSKIQGAAESIAMHDELFDNTGASDDIIEAISIAIERIRDKQERLDESLSYAREIQIRALTSERLFSEAFSDHAVFRQPLALVSGDFYWLRRFPTGTVLICGDCTGHGIPGALMTMMVVSLLESIINERNCGDTGYILWKLDEQLAAVLNRSHPESDKPSIKDGLDAAAIFIDNKKNVSISATNMKIFKVKPLNTVEVINGQRFFIGEGKIGAIKNVRTVRVRREDKTCWFIATDGLFEQMGGERGVPYGYSRFKKLIHRESAYGMKACIDAVGRDFQEYMSGTLQRDDVTVIGFKI